MMLNFRRTDPPGGSDRPPVVILHGLFGSGDNWLGVARAIESEYTVLLPDLPNHGGSPHTSSFSYPEMAEAVVEFLSEEEIPRCILTGHSMGGKTAMAVALKYPQRVERLCVVDIAPKSDPARHTQILAAMQEVAEAAVHSRREAEAIMARRLESARERAFLQKSLGEDEYGVYRWKLNLDLIRRDYETAIAWPYHANDGVQPYDGAVMFIAGGKSGYLKQSDLSQIRQLFPNASMREIADAGHWVHADRPDEFLSVYRSFLSGNI